MQKQMTQQVIEEIQKRLEMRTFSISIGGVEMELIKKGRYRKCTFGLL